jgi:hypothetical protein
MLCGSNVATSRTDRHQHRRMSTRLGPYSPEERVEGLFRELRL